MHRPLRYYISLLALIIFLPITNSGCFTYRVMDTPIGADINPYASTEWSFFWGLKQGEEKQHVCEENGIANFRVKDNILFSVISVATLGIANPTRIEWECSPERDSHGEIDQD